MDHKKTLRRLDAVDVNADVFIVSQALAENQLRKTGVNFFSENGMPGSTGKNLEGILNQIGRTVYPPKNVQLENGIQISNKRMNYISVYNSEIAHCYPGKNRNGKGDRRPSFEEIKRCLHAGFLTREIEIIRPKIIILMGRLSRDIFFHHVLRTSFPKSLTDHISQIVYQREIPEFEVGNHKSKVMPLQHASGANPRYRQLLQDNNLIEMMKKALL